jgi:serine/threonine protein kinase
LFCQELFCPAERAPRLLDAGEWLGDIEVVRLLAVLRAATLYEARQRGCAVLLKVAHPDTAAVARLKREARVLAELGVHSAQRAGLPELLPPYVSTTLRANPYGRAMLGGQLLYFCLFVPFEGIPLRAILAERPQLWVYQLGWLLNDVARALALLQSRDLVHYALCPEAILVRFDERSGAPTVLLADLGLAVARPELAQAWTPELLPPSYTAPELVGTDEPPASYAVDVYGLGLLLFELLSGAQAYPQSLSSDAEVLALLRRPRKLRSGREEDVRELAALADQAASHDQSQRPRNAADFATRLRAAVGDTPPRRAAWLPAPRQLLAAAVTLMALAFLLACAASVFALVSSANAATGL